MKRTILKKATRNIDISEESISDNVVSFSVASSYPVRRENGRASYNEILEISEESINFERLVDGRCPVLFEHEADKQIGVVERAWIEDGKLKVTAKFSESEFAQQILADIKAGIRRNVSFGYIVDDMKKLDSENVLITRFTPYETSIVSCPADPEVGYLRNLSVKGDNMDKNTNKNPEEEEKNEDVVVENDNKISSSDSEVENSSETARELADSDSTEDRNCESATKDPGTASEDGAVEEHQQSGEEDPEAKDAGSDEKADQEKSAEQEVKADAEEKAEEVPAEVEPEKAEDEDEIRALGKLTNNEDAAQKFISERRSLNDFKNYVKENKTLEETTTMKNYSICNAIRNASQKLSHTDNSYETELTLENKRSLGISDEYDVVVKKSQMRALGPSASYGAELVNTTYLPGQFVPLARPAYTLAQTGYRSVPVENGPISFATVLSGAVAQMVDLDGNLPDTDLRFATKEMKARKVGCCVPVPYSLLLQGTPEAEAIVTDDIVKAIEAKKDEMCLIGDGTGNEPTGIFNTTGVNTIDIADAFSLSGVLSMQKLIRDSNDFSENLFWVMNSNNLLKYQSTLKSAVAGADYLASEDGKMLGHKIIINNALSDNQIVLGNFDELIVADWEALQIKIDDITFVKKQAIQVIAYGAFDCLVRRPGSFTITEA